MIGGGVSFAFTDAPLAQYAVNNFLDGTPMYIGKSTADGRWLLMKFDTGTGVMQYANIGTSPSYLTYADAWAARASLTYTNYASLTGV